MHAKPAHIELALDLLRLGALDVTAAGASMAPTVPVGSRVRIVAAAAVKTGDVGLFRTTTAPGFLLHRVVARLPGGLVVHRGDAPGATAGLARKTDLLGRADLPRLRLGVTARLAAVFAALRAR